MKRREGLISLKTFSAHGLEVLSNSLKTMPRYFDIKRLSGVYRVERAAESFISISQVDGEEQLEGYVVVVEIATDQTLEELVDSLDLIEQSFQHQVTRRLLSINLLMVGTETLKTPRLTLPHPEFHMRPEELIPACELWPEIQHPIVGKPLIEIARELPRNLTWGEFYCQGLRLVDTSLAIRGTE